MEKRKIEALRDLAIAHYPKASKMRADAVKYQGGMWADSGLTNALMFEDYAAPAVEKVAHDLLQLTFMHPDARPVDPHVWDAVEDAETIATKAHTLEMAVEMQPQTEAAMLDAARLLCELTGAALPPWIDAAGAPTAKGEAEQVTTPAPVTTNRLRRNTLDPAIEKAIKQAGNMKPADVYLKLKALAIEEEKPFTGALDGDALCYTDDNNQPAKLSKGALGKRLKRR